MADASRPPEADPESLTLPQQVVALLNDLPGLVSDRVQLLSLELKRASRALAQVVALALFAAILVATAWLSLWVGIAAALVHAGMSWPWACLLVMVVNLVAAVWAGSRLKALAPLLALPATLRRLTDSDARERTDADRLARERGARESAAAGMNETAQGLRDREATP